MKTFIPDGYTPVLGIYETQKAIGTLKRLFEDCLAGKLCLRRVSAPLFVDGASGLNDNLNGIERPVEFGIAATGGSAQVVQSLAKWKRLALMNYGFAPGTGLCTDMNAIRRDEELDNLHSVYVDQWDWEKIMLPGDRNADFLKKTVCDIVAAICDTHRTMKLMFPQLKTEISPDVSFITTQELEDLYPDKTPKERENLYLRDHRTAFIMQIGRPLRSGIKHDGRAPDYDDWNLNGDILFWNDVLGCAFEISSMGIRVDEKSLDEQLTLSGCDDRRALPFHKMLLAGRLPLTIGGGIGQSRLCMLLLGKAHVGEVQVSVWDKETLDICKKAGVALL